MREHRAEVELQMNGFPRVAVGYLMEQGAHLNFNSEFFHEFASQAFLERLTRLAFASRKFPQPRKMNSGETLGDQQPAFVKHQPCRDLDQCDAESLLIPAIWQQESVLRQAARV